MSNAEKFARIWEEDLVIPTYPVGERNKNPMFLENRVYQGSSGVVYPHPVIDKLSDEKIDRTYRVIYLENPYIKIMIMPELGGRVQMAIDKTNDYRFVYHNQVIKPALVGLLGAWCSGGIEFNWPQTHRPSTFDPVDFTIEENEDGSKTAWVGENERMFRTRGMNGYTIHPDKAYLEIKGRFYNRTSVPQHFMMWANPSVHVNKDYQSLFPPDVNLMFDHAKRDSTKWPVATGEYYKIDYSEGVDISHFKNTPVPNSFMACPSNYDFLGGYDHGKSAGMVHIANRHIAPGKKMWTWGNGDFGDVWCGELTDEDGPYNELMAGIYTDNQPDFSWMQPGERRKYTHYFMPFKGLGGISNASRDVVVNLVPGKDSAKAGVYLTSPGTVKISLSYKGQSIMETTENLSPENWFEQEIPLPPENGASDEADRKDFVLSVQKTNGTELLRYAPAEEKKMDRPEVSKATPQPEEIRSVDELYVTGLHLEQYRHVTYQPQWYYLEGLKRDPDDYKCNIAMGLYEYRRGCFTDAVDYFKTAVKRLTSYNLNPATGEVYYHLGWAYMMIGNMTDSYAAFYKSVWSGEWRGAGYFAIAQIEARLGKYSQALESVNTSLEDNASNLRARHLKIILMRTLGQFEEGLKDAENQIADDVLDFGALFEQFLCRSALNRTNEAEKTLALFIHKMRGNPHNYIELAIDYGTAGFYTEALDLLTLYIKRFKTNPESVLSFGDVSPAGITSTGIYPMVYYYMSYYARLADDSDAALSYLKLAEQQNSDYCWPNRLESIQVLQSALELNPEGAFAPYYLGCFRYHMRDYDKALFLWENSREINPEFPTVWRNLALAYYNKKNDPDRAGEYLEKAFALNPEDGRLLLELDQYYKAVNRSPEERLAFLESHMALVKSRDDLYLERVSLTNLISQPQMAYDQMMDHRFHPWEGGEGKVAGQYKFSLIELAKEQISSGSADKAVQLLESARTYPRNLGEGKLQIQPENDIDYFTALAYEKGGNKEKAEEYFKLAAGGTNEIGNAMAYNDLPPDMIFYQGMALMRLNQSKTAKGQFNRLVDFGTDHQDDEMDVPFFIYSLQDFLIFDTDYTKTNKVLCHYLKGLGYLGLGQIKKASKELKQVFDLNLYHHEANVAYKLVQESI